MHIPDKYRDRYEALAQEHPWMREMRDETNGDGGETNGIAASAPLVDEPVEKLRDWSKWLDCVYATDDGKAYCVYNYKPYENMKSCGEYMRDLVDAIADMIERDYVHREAYEDLRDEFVWETTFLHRMGKKCGTKDVPSLVAYVEKLEAEVAELKRKLEIADRHEFESDQACDECKEHTDELLAELTAERDEWKAKAEAKSAKRAAAVERLRGSDAIGYLGVLKVAFGWESGSSHSDREWRDALIDLLTDSPMDAQSDTDGTCPDANRTASNDSGQIADMSEKSADDVRNDKKMSENDVRAESVDANDGNENLGSDLGSVSKVGSEVDSREKLCTLDVYGKDGKLHSSTDIPKPSWELDSREKLEADCKKLIRNIQERIFSGRDAGALRCQLKELLDRQAAIEKRRFFDCIAEHQAENLKLQGRIRELQKQVDSLTVRAVAAEEEADELTVIADRLTDDREMYRDLCGQMLDAMDEIRAKVDASFPRGAREVM